MKRSTRRLSATQRSLLVSWLVLAAIAAVLLVLARNGLGIPCPVLRITGLYCPGCGAARAFAALSRFDLAAAWRYNPVIVALIVPLAVLLVVDGAAAWKGKKAKQGLFTKGFSVLAIVALVVFGILRNLPGFEMLRPL